MRRMAMLILGGAVAAAGVGCGSGNSIDSGFYTNKHGENSAMEEKVITVDSTERLKENQQLGLTGEATIMGKKPGTLLRVIVHDVFETAFTDGRTTPPGSRVMAVEIQVVNAGTRVFNDTPASGATVIDAKGKAYKSEPSTVTVDGGEVFPNPFGLQPRDQRTALVPFVVPAGANIKQVGFRIDKGGESGLWRVP
ncbi:hypothetical protein FB381_3988 [Nocardioides albertanoniae]|uniref:DUF4352 domain-containing protein n=1 Tax=Nocardioides albertanoniae TaxID=1175486 RepID=A0A543ABT5_9ACTN|nr:hypothetical protein [Nocardioides albertanoniae]TQL70063.1 hypothetical protein FB381_3988 [Nocardioides albertanoniae]